MERLGQIFKPSELMTYTDNSANYLNSENITVPKVSIIRPWGELRTFLSELYFLTIFWDSSVIKEPELVIITENFPEHYNLLRDLFPYFNFTIFSLEPFTFKEQKSSLYKKAVSYNRLPDTEDLEELKLKNGNIYMIFNLSNSYLEYQMKIHQEIDPVKSFMRIGLDTLPDTNLRYLDGIALRQAFAKKDSVEFFLIPHDSITLRDWPMDQMANLIKYHNNVTRESIMENNDTLLEPKKDPYYNRNLGILRSYDGIYLIYVTRQYLRKFNPYNKGKNITPVELNNVISFILVNLTNSGENRLVPKKR